MVEYEERHLSNGDYHLGRHRERSDQCLGLTAREELKQLLKRSPGQRLDGTEVTNQSPRQILFPENQRQMFNP